MRIAALLCFAATASLAQQAGVSPLSAEQAKAIVPRADLSGLTDAQRGVFVEVATDVFNYAGCQDTLAKCLAADQKDPHAPRMGALVKQLAGEGLPATTIVQSVEKYYSSFESGSRVKLNAENCPTLGKGPVNLVEFSDYQCPHCAHAVAPLEHLVLQDRKGEVRLCSKYFPFSSHPRARVAAACAEYARTKGKFWEMNALIFANQEALEDENLKEYAKKLGLNGDEMLKQVYAGAFDEQVEKHRREGIAAGVESTPALFIDGRYFLLPVKPWYLAFTVDDELQWRREKGWKFAAVAPAQRKDATATAKK
jgi:protein-disulfide isomerase